MKLYDVIRKEELENRRTRNAIVEEDESALHPPQYDEPKVRLSVKKVSIIVGIVLFLIGLYVLGIKYVRATVVINEREIPFSINRSEFELLHEKAADTERLSFQTMVVTSEINKEVFGSEVTASITKAKGKVIFFNEYSKSAQKIKSGTTLSSSTGKKYVTTEAVIVPGYTLNGKVKVTGTSTPISIVATDTGPTYNSEGVSFVVSGYSGSASSKQFYARSAGAIGGGETGAQHTVAKSDIPTIMTTLQAQLTERLKRETRSQIPDDLITFPELQFITIDPNSLSLTGQNIKFSASLKGTMVSYLISRELLERTIATKVMSNEDYTNVTIPALADLKVDPLSVIPLNPNTVPDSIKVLISGEGKIITKIPVEYVKTSLVGKSRKEFTSSLLPITEIDKARFKLIPFWAPFFPKQIKDIAVEIK